MAALAMDWTGGNARDQKHRPPIDIAMPGAPPRSMRKTALTQ
jgi:hypothetical protein